jgi:predicted SnoaL-like aldol condensation-catalyzing enzyme
MLNSPILTNLEYEKYCVNVADTTSGFDKYFIDLVSRNFELKMKIVIRFLIS